MASFAIFASATVSNPIIAPVTTALLPVVTIVPVSFGIVIVLSAVGSVTCIVVSCASSVAPSNIRVLPAFKFKCDPILNVPVVFVIFVLAADGLICVEPA